MWTHRLAMKGNSLHGLLTNWLQAVTGSRCVSARRCKKFPLKKTILLNNNTFETLELQQPTNIYGHLQDYDQGILCSM